MDPKEVLRWGGDADLGAPAELIRHPARSAMLLGPRLPMGAGLLLGAAGSAALIGLGSGSSYLRFLPLLVGLGIGMGFLTAAVVTAAIRAVSAERAGLASGVNNTARQAAGGRPLIVAFRVPEQQAKLLLLAFPPEAVPPGRILTVGGQLRSSEAVITALLFEDQGAVVSQEWRRVQNEGLPV